MNRPRGHSSSQSYTGVTIELRDVLDLYQRHLYMPDLGGVLVTLATVVANLVDGDLVWPSTPRGKRRRQDRNPEQSARAPRRASGGSAHRGGAAQRDVEPRDRQGRTWRSATSDR